MSRSAAVDFEWGDGPHTFRLALGQLQEVQEKTGVGPLTLLRRLDSGDWMTGDAREVLRCGLIGGGMAPLDALALVKRYVDDRPFAEAVKPAYLVLAAALFGTPEEELPGKTEAAMATTTGSASPLSTDTEPSSDTPPNKSTE